MAEQIVEEVVETQEQPTIHGQAYWDNYLTDLGERWDAQKTTAMQERTDAEKAEWDAFVWGTVVELIHAVRQLATEKPVVPEVKTPRKRTPKVPAAALPELNTDTTNAA